MVKLGQNYAVWLAVLLVVAAAAFVLFGLAGFRTILAIAVLFVIPPLLFLKNTSLAVEEKIFFSLFIGIGLFPLLAWLVNQVLPSFRVSVIAALAVAGAAAAGRQRDHRPRRGRAGAVDDRDQPGRTRAQRNHQMRQAQHRGARQYGAATACPYHRAARQ